MRRERRLLVAGSILMLGFVYLAFEFIAAMAWTDPPYDWARNFISDLGFSDCAVVDGDRICSPLHPLMNAGLLIQGSIFTIGSILVVRLTLPDRTRRLVAGVPLVLSGVGTFFVGVFHQSLALYEADLNWLHILAATLAIGAGNIGIVLLGAFLLRSAEWRWYAIAILIVGIVGLVGSLLLINDIDFGLGIGLIERIAVYPLNTWTIGTGVGLLVKGARDSVLHGRARRAAAAAPASTAS
ncbi:DUF998 domain-containing protein [Marisediminicola senii]|uniref:DUF998 domain-containing protein n=1 Tax=Marisediminicola senii TaxID=2711233 RepID=UPI0013EAFAE3|nr:DUF998 domain-containing protein [Marisediminicola senii]